MTYLDTHTVVALYAGDVSAFQARALTAIESDDDLRVSPMVVLELQYLKELGRIKPSAKRIIEELSTEMGVTICEAPFGDVVTAALTEKWTRDPFDRMIVAQARIGRATIITRDRQIQQHYDRAVG